MVRPTLILRATEWSSTLHLPKSSLPHRALSETRLTYIKRCADDLYAWQAANRPAENTFILADGPPYANGDVHVGHALNKILKDIICRFQLSAGKRVHYVPGWDCHGLPIEIKALQTIDAHTRMTPMEVRDAARNLAVATIDKQKQAFRDWAVMGDWNNAYQTMEQGFELKQLEVFKNMVRKGLIYRQYKPVYWSPSSRTALAEAELEYDVNHVSHAAYVKFKLVDLPAKLQSHTEGKDLYALIWTTTPWSLPANRAIAIGNEIEYSILQIEEEKDLILLSTDSIGDVIKARGLRNTDIRLVAQGLMGKEIKGASYMNPLQGHQARQQLIVHGSLVNTTSGSGLVHIAPAHGQEDFELCQKLGIGTLSPVDDAGCFTDEAFPNEPSRLAGKAVLKEGNAAVIELLQNEYSSNLVWATHKYKHKYPIDWRTKLPLVVRATAQWFAKVDSIKKPAISALSSVNFLPMTSRARLESFIAGRSEWCISRQRAWGVPIPALYREINGITEAIMTPESVDHIIKIIRQRGTNAWWTDPIDDPIWIHPDLSQGKYSRGKDTMDVWFDSGTTWTQLRMRDHAIPVADVYVEGSDQHRGWFQSSLLTYVANQQPEAKHVVRAPFRTLITHGFTLDAKSRKMSKSLGNVISPAEIMEGTLLPPLKKRKGLPTNLTHDAMGPDALRLWVASNDYTGDVSIGVQLLQSVNLSLHKFRITFRWLLGNLNDYNPNSISLQNYSQHLMDIIAVHQLSSALRQSYHFYQAYEPFKALSAINRYINNDLSAFYFEAAKDQIYAGETKHRLRVQTTCFDILRGLLQMLTPVLPLLVTEVVDHSPPGLKTYFEAEENNPLRKVWNPPKYTDAAQTESLEKRTKLVQCTINAVRAAQEKARVKRKIGSGLDCDVLITLSETGLPAWVRDLFHETMRTGELEEFLVVSRVHLEATADPAQKGAENDEWAEFQHSVELDDIGGGSIVVRILPSSNGKCPRCWRYAVPMDPQNQHGEKLCNRCESVMNSNSNQ